MPDDSHQPPAKFFLWLSHYTGFPRHRLPAAGELLLLFGGLAQDDHFVPSEAADTSPKTSRATRDQALQAAQRTHAELRKRVHRVCNNSAKV